LCVLAQKDGQFGGCLRLEAEVNPAKPRVAQADGGAAVVEPSPERG
jgi:hypothetical protein